MGIVLEIGLALALMAGAGLLANRLRFSIVPLLILAGLLCGPQAPQLGPFSLKFSDSAPILHFMGRFGVVFLLFYLGLEFSVGRLMRSGRAILGGGLIYLAINLPLGLLLPFLLGWPLKETLVAAGITAISSSAIVAKVLVELRRVANPETELILGLMMFQDVFVAAYLFLLSGLVLTGAASALNALAAVGLSLGFMLGFLALGYRLTPRLNRWLNIPADETFLLVLFAVMILTAGLSEIIHLAEAIGALLAGLVLAETEHRERIEHLIVPFRDVFGALFFFSFGLSIDPRALSGAIWPALAALGLTLAGNFAAGLLAGRTAGLSHRAAVNVGLTITARGEFSIILANLAQAGGLLAVLQPFAALYILALATLGPFLTMHSRRIYAGLALVAGWPQALKGRNAPGEKGRRPG